MKGKGAQGIHLVPLPSLRKMMRHVVFIFLLISLSFLSCTREEELGSITGRITGEDGNPILGISVHAILEGRVVGWGRSELEGVYIITNLKPGIYSVKAWGIGYEDNIREGVEVRAGKITTGVDFVMRKKGLGP